MTVGKEMPLTKTDQAASRHVEVFVVLDLDRTLLDTDALIEAICRLLPDYGVSQADARAEIDYIKAQVGKSLPIFSYLRQKYTEDVLILIQEKLYERAQAGGLGKELLYDGTSEVFGQLDKRNVPYAVVTHGTQADQDFKLTLFRMLVKHDATSLPGLVTSERHKAEWVYRSWRKTAKSKGVYQIPPSLTPLGPISADRIVIIDDKQQNLYSPDESIRGVWINNSASSRQSQTLRQLATTLGNSDASLTDVASWYKKRKL